MKKNMKVHIITAIVIVVVLALLITATALMNTYPTVMNGVFGRGDMHVVTIEGAEDWEGNYIDFECATVDESLEYATNVNQKIAAEGIVLLKNEDNCLPLAEGEKVTLLGKNVGHHVTAPTNDVQSNDLGITIGDSLISSGAFDVNQKVWEFYKGQSQSNDGSGEIAPTSEQYQTNVEANYGNYTEGTAIVLFRRSYSEGTDPSRDMGSSENNRTALSLSANELALLQEACDSFKQVVVLVSSPNTMELAFLTDGANYTDPYTEQSYDFSKVKGAYWIGGLGLTGADSLTKILKGDIAPSGHLVDTYVRDIIDDNPAMVNFGKFEYIYDFNKTDFYAEHNYTVDYEEGIYVGYKYYETAAYEAKNNNYEGFDYDETVLYPFGYGMSYTTFDMSYNEQQKPYFDDETDEFVFSVDVKNTGDKYTGKTAIQIYVSAPYIPGGIEKSHVALAGFAKTGDIAPGDTETYEVRVQRDYVASYDYKTAKCYVLDEGDYDFYLSDDAHSWASIADDNTARLWTYNQKEKIEFKEDGAGSEDKRTSDVVAAENILDKDSNWKFTEYTDKKTGYLTNFTRSNFKESYPTAPTEEDLKVLSTYLVESLKRYDPFKDYTGIDSPYADVVKITEEQVTEVDRGVLVLADMRGVDFDDPSWDTFIDQLSLAELQEAYLIGGWGDMPIEDLGCPSTLGGDSPSGITIMRGGTAKTHYPYCAEVLLCSTWNVELARAYGDALAEEAQTQRELNKGQAINYLLGGGADTHRSAFGGRNHEYFSEDGFIAGKMAAAEASGAGEKGFIMLFKHCALNEQETMRQGSEGMGGSNDTTYTSFANEQAVREIYMRPWEIYAKEAVRHVKYYNENGELESKEMSAASAIMTSYNRVGTVWSGASPIVYKLLREECGFTGTSFTDAGGTATSYMSSDFGLVTGGTSGCLMDASGGLLDPDSNTAVYYLKQAVKIKLFNVANGNAMLGLAPGSSIVYDLAPWEIGLIVAWVIFGVLAAAAIALNVVLFIKSRKAQ